MWCKTTNLSLSNTENTWCEKKTQIGRGIAEPDTFSFHTMYFSDTDGQTPEKVIPMSRNASQATHTQKK